MKSNEKKNIRHLDYQINLNRLWSSNSRRKKTVKFIQRLKICDLLLNSYFCGQKVW